MIEFEKFHGTGNDFFVIDAAEGVPDRRRFAIECCDREDGLEYGRSVGADGVLFLALEDGYASPRVVMTLVQPDGSTAAMCGNGARCAAAWAARRLRRRDEGERSEALYASMRTGSTPTRERPSAASTARRSDRRDERERATPASAAEPTGETTVMVDTQAGTRRATVGDSVSIEMGIPRFAPDAVPLARDEPLVAAEFGELCVTAVNTGVPHAVAFVEDVFATDLASVAPPVRHAETFPRGANVTLASPNGDNRREFDQRTYERGVEGETDSCGTGAVAVAAVARKLGLVEGESVSVRPPGGRLNVEFSGRGAVLSGPTEREFAGRVSMGPSRTVEVHSTDAVGDD